MTMRSPSRLMPAWRMFLSRIRVRRSAAVESSRLVSAPFMSTCSRKCTPPRRSRPRYIGRACSAVSHCGEARQQVQRHDVLIGILQPYLDAGGVEEDAVMHDGCSLQCGFDAFKRASIDLDGGLDARQLNGRGLAEEVGQGVDEADHQRQRHNDVLPEGISVHASLGTREGQSRCGVFASLRPRNSRIRAPSGCPSAEPARSPVSEPVLQRPWRVQRRRSFRQP
jgi:hypothetical protein